MKESTPVCVDFDAYGQNKGKERTIKTTSEISTAALFFCLLSTVTTLDQAGESHIFTGKSFNG